MELDDELSNELSTHDLVKHHRKLADSGRRRDQLAALVVRSELGGRLHELSDRQIGQLLFDFCWPMCSIDGPDVIIITQAVDRLRRSTGGPGTTEEDELKRQRPCSKCENEMFLHEGIDEPDFWRCDYAACRRKIYVSDQ